MGLSSARIKQVVRHCRTTAFACLRKVFIVPDMVRIVTKEVPYLEAEVAEGENADPYKLHRTHRGASAANAERCLRSTCAIMPKLPPDIHSIVSCSTKDCGKLADYIAANIFAGVYRETGDSGRNCIQYAASAKAHSHSGRGNQDLAIENEIQEKAKEQMDKNQREYYLREQMKAIAYELGEEDDNPQEEADELREKIKRLTFPEESRTTS